MKKEEIMLNTQLPEPTQFEIDSFNKYKASPKYIVKYKQYLLIWHYCRWSSTSNTENY